MKNLTHSSAPYVGLDDATKCRQNKSLKEMLAGPQKLHLETPRLWHFFNEIAIPPVFYEGKYKNQ